MINSDSSEYHPADGMQRFFPRDRLFWLCHGGALLVLSVAQGIIIYFRGGHQQFDTIGFVLWLPLFTAGVLLFRHHYRERGWWRLNITRLILLSLGYALLSAAVITVLLLSFTLPFYWDEILAPEYLRETGNTTAGALTAIVIGNTVSTQLMTSAWIFIYLAVTTGRRARAMELTNLKLENRLKEARLSNLSNQLNPHFLFNSLNNIRFMIHENPEQADKAITAFSEILRYSLQSGHKDKVTLGGELAIVKRYIEVIGLQLESRLDFHVSVAGGLSECLIPPMSVQLLVENAIKHGVQNMKTPADLRVEARSDGRLLVLIVSNPVPPESAPERRNTGTGLNNVEQRLRLLYGEKAGLSVDHKDNRFTVELRLPKETNQ